MGAYPDAGGGVNPTKDTTILIRNHENRERAGEFKVVTGPEFEYDEETFGGNTKLVVERRKTGKQDANGQVLYEYAVVDKFAILGGTSTNCAGGELPFKKWITCVRDLRPVREARRREQQELRQWTLGRQRIGRLEARPHSK